MNKILYVFLLCGLSACATLEKNSSTSNSSPAIQKQTVSKSPHAIKVAKHQAEDLTRYSARFLYMGAQTALQEQQPNLARQFLEALNQKLNASNDPSEKFSIEPRLQLIQQWLRINQVAKSETLLHNLMQHHDLLLHEQRSDVLRLYTLYARVLLAADKEEDASDVLTRVLSVAPDFLPARDLQIALFMKKKQWDLAHIAIQAAIQRHDTAALRKLNAEVFVHEKKYTQALASLKHMQHFLPNHAGVALLQSEVAYKSGDKKAAKAYLQSFLTSHPKNLQVKNRLAALYIQSGDYMKATHLFQELSNQMPKSAEVASSLGVLFYQQKQMKQAAHYFQQAYELEPKGQGHAFYWAASLEALNQIQKARSLYQSIPKTDSSWLDAQLRLASMDFKEKKFDAVQKNMLALVKTHPEASHAWILLSSSYLNQKQYQKLLDNTQGGTLLNKPSPRLILNRAIALEHFKRYDEVESTLQAVIQAHPKHSEALNFLAYVYAEQGIKLAQAETYIQRAIKIKPNDGYYLDSLAWVYYQQENYKRAIQVQRKALTFIKQDATMQEHLGDMLWKYGDHDAAIKQWTLALSLNPENSDVLKSKLAHGL